MMVYITFRSVIAAICIIIGFLFNSFKISSLFDLTYYNGLLKLSLIENQFGEKEGIFYFLCELNMI